MEEIADKIKERIREMKEDRRRLESRFGSFGPRIDALEETVKAMASATMETRALRQGFEETKESMARLEGAAREEAGKGLKAMEARIGGLEDAVEEIRSIGRMINTKSDALQKKLSEEIKKELLREMGPSLREVADKAAQAAHSELRAALLSIVEGGLEKNREAIDKSMEQAAGKKVSEAFEKAFKELEKETERISERSIDHLERKLMELEMELTKEAKRHIERELEAKIEEESKEIRKQVSDNISRFSGSVSSLEERFILLEKEVRAKLGAIEELRLEEFVKAKELESLKLEFRGLRDEVSTKNEEAISNLTGLTRGELSLLRKEAENLQLELETAINEKIAAIKREVAASVASIYKDSQAMSMNRLKEQLEDDIKNGFEERQQRIADIAAEDVYRRAKGTIDQVIREKGYEFKLAMASEVNSIMKGFEEKVRKNVNELMFAMKEEVKKELRESVGKTRETEKKYVEIIGFDEDETRDKNAS